MSQTLAPNTNIHDARSKSASTGTVSRALQLLAVLAGAGGAVSVKYVSDTMGLAPSTAHRLLQLLRKEGFVDGAASGRLYGIGAQFYRVAAQVYANRSPGSLAQPLIQSLADEFNEAVVFGQYLPVQKAMSFTAHADGIQRLKYQIEMHVQLSLVWGASGKAILAFLPDDVIRGVLCSEAPSPATGAPVPPLDELERELATIRRRGYAVSHGEKLLDARGIAAPVYDARGVTGCICLTSPKSRRPHGTIAQIGARVASVAAELSNVLGAV